MTPTIPIRRLISEVYPRFPRAFTMGTYNRRKIAGSNTWSQHSWANAEDIGVPTLTDGDAVFAWLKLNATRLGLRRFGLRRRPALWRVRNHFDHLHVEGRPKKKGIPPLPGTIPQEEDMLRAGDDTSADPGRGAVGRLQDLLKSAGFPAVLPMAATGLPTEAVVSILARLVMLLVLLRLTSDSKLMPRYAPMNCSLFWRRWIKSASITKETTWRLLEIFHLSGRIACGAT